jgi:hypothetical protein
MIHLKSSQQDTNKLKKKIVKGCKIDNNIQINKNIETK